jgi:hypothetical protein
MLCSLYQNRFQPLDMPQPTTGEAIKDYRARYEELTGSSLCECPVCHQGRMLVIEIVPRSLHRRVGDQGYLLMKRTAFGCKSNCGAQTWLGQALGAVLPDGSSRSLSPGTELSSRYHDSLEVVRITKASHTFIASVRFRSSSRNRARQSIPIGPRAGHRFSPTHF